MVTLMNSPTLFLYDTTFHNNAFKKYSSMYILILLLFKLCITLFMIITYTIHISTL